MQMPLLDIAGSGAEFSLDRMYRYKLWREWDSTKGCVAFVGLNPSTADERVDDPTVRRCINYAKAWGFGRLVMLNIFAFRATDPKMMMANMNPVGPGNIETIVEVARSSSMVVACWGAHGAYRGQGRQVMELLDRARVPLHCLGVTKGGHPKHPLYLKKDLKPELLEGSLYGRR